VTQPLESLDIAEAAERWEKLKPIDALLLDGLNSGEPIPATVEYWEEKKARE